MNQLVAGKILIPAVIGIMLAQYMEAQYVLLLLAIAIMTSVGINVLSKSIYQIKWGRSFTIWFMIVMVFAVNMIFKNREMLREAAVDISGKKNFVGIIEDYPKIDKYTNASVSLLSLEGKPTSAIRVQLTADQNAALTDGMPGDTIVGLGYFYKLKANKNPYAFDYSEHLARQSIFHRARVYDQHAVINSQSYGLRYKLKWQLRNILHHNVKQVVSRENWGIALALLLGDRSSLDQETKTNFKNVGAIHVLAISGLHVGIFMAIFLFILNRIPLTWSRVRIATILSLIAFLFCLCELTGQQPPVRRAAIMLSFFLIAGIGRDRTTSLNLLFLSALIILGINPKSLFELSFQLSFTAVLGIITIYPFLYKSISLNNYFLNKIWQLVCLSIAAQTFTFPLTIYYFNQFPLLFALSSIVAILCATIAIYGGIVALIILPFSHVVATFIGQIVDRTFEVLKYSMSFMAQYEWLLMKDLWIFPVELFLLLIGTILCVVFLHLRKVLYLKKAILSVILVLSYRNYTWYQSTHQKNTIHYEARYPIVDIFYGNTVYSWHHPDLSENEINYITYRNRKAHFISKKLQFNFE